MENRRPVAGEFYRHFKGNLYQILTIGKYADTLEEMVVYQALYGTFDTYIRPLKEFVETVDLQKYPDATQKYRFNRVVFSDMQKNERIDKAMDSICVQSGEQRDIEHKVVSHTEEVERLFLDFLDAETSREKMELLEKLKPDLDLRIVNNIAASMDLPVDEDDVERQYEFIMQNLKQRSKFECNRLR